MPNSVCLDASFVIRLLSSEAPDALALRWWRQAMGQGVAFYAPPLLYFEVTNALYQYVRHRLLSPQTANALLEQAQALDIRLYMDPALHQAALQTAHRLKLPATYDAHYVALAQRLGAELWTADQRLARTLRQQGFPVRVLTP